MQKHNIFIGCATFLCLSTGLFATQTGCVPQTQTLLDQIFPQNRNKHTLQAAGAQDEYAEGDSMAVGFQNIEKKAAMEDIEAQYKLAWRYQSGNGVPKNTRKAEELFQKAEKNSRKAADNGNSKAMYLLSIMYSSERGDIPKDERKEMEWLKKAVDRENADAQFRLASKYMLGKGVPRNERKANELLQKSAENGCGIALYQLACLYKEGGISGFPKNDQKALELFQRAANNGNVSALLSLAEMYSKGDGVPKDERKAKEFQKKADAARKARDAEM